MDPSNLIMRKACIISSMMALREIARVFPMVALNESMTRLAVGDAIGEIHSATIRVYDIERYSLQVAESCYHRAVKLCITNGIC
jgi:WD repeat-containing protein 7